MPTIAAVHSYLKRLDRTRIMPRAADIGPDAAKPYLVPDLCKAYQWPAGLAGGGVIGIVELGGGYIASDLKAFFDGLGQPMPAIEDVSVDGTVNTPTPGDDSPDLEVALDIEVASAAYYIATGKPATIRMYWSQDIGTAVAKAAADGCDVCSISWGADEKSWGKESGDAMEATAIAAVSGGMIVFAASGDNDSSDGGSNPANVDLPASCPHVIGCGGTRKTTLKEIVWNDHPGDAFGDGTGGGFSTLFPMPAWQAGAPHGPGRMVPDVAGDAAPSTGYEIYVHGGQEVVGGTSAVAPLYAGLFAAFGKKLASNTSTGAPIVTSKLYLNQLCFVDIVLGDNGKYKAGPAPNPCCGLGVPVGVKLAALFLPAQTV